MTNKLRFLIAAVAMGVSMPAFAEPFEFTRDGLHFVGEKTLKRDAYVLRGRSLEDGKQFELRVANGRVAGTVGGTPVSFKLADAHQVALASAQ
jgi:hypothetical protein